MQNLKKLLDLLTPRERRRAGLLLGMIVVMALLDMIGVASIMPFMAVLANPELIETNSLLKGAFSAASSWGIHSIEGFLFALGVLVFVLLVFSLAFKALTNYALLCFTMMREYSIGKRLLEGYLHQPYTWFLSRRDADLKSVVLSEVNQVILNAARPMMVIIAQGAVSASLLTLLIMIDHQVALTLVLTLVAAYTLIFKVTRGLLSRIGKERVKANQGRFVAVSEAFGAAKEVKVGGLEQAYIQRFSAPAQTYARHQATAQVTGQLPRFAMEAIAFGGMLLVTLYLMSRSASFASALPIISLYAFAGYRLMPALQQIYSAVTQLRFAGPALDALHADITTLQPPHRFFESAPHPNILQLQHAVTLKQIVYSYPSAPQPALKNLNLTIPAKSTVGLVGATGSGKTTTVDLILGLLEAQEGTIEVDGQAITEHNRRAWQRAIGYVPQQIYLADDTVAANIAFGLDAQDIDQEAVERAAKIANLHDFVVNELPQQYQTTVGERGVRLSGGQRQRIGIARAMYHKPQVLILDEATSALDTLTERTVVEAVNKIGRELTIIIVTHRYSTLTTCDTILLLENGQIKAQGSFHELMQLNKKFQGTARPEKSLDIYT